MSRALPLVLAFAFCLTSTGSALAQSGQNGSIVGYVFDQAGMPLRGVKVVAESPTQIGGAKTSYTNDEGMFRMLALIPGTFKVRASAPKLKTVIQNNVKVGISSATELNLVMEVETATEQVTVIEQAPLISTSKAEIKETFDLEMVENLPHGSRDNIHRQVLDDIAGGMNGRVRGGNADQTIFSQDGFEMTGNYPVLKSSAAYEISSGGYGTDNPRAAGGAINLVTKSGSNKFEFEFNATADSNRLQFFEDETDGGAARYFYVINPLVSGPIIKDKLWYHFTTESHIIQRSRDGDPTGFLPNPATYRKFIQKGTLKLTWQITPRNKIATLNNFDSPHEWNMQGNLGVAPEAQRNRHGWRQFNGIIWESLLTDSLVLRSQAGFIWVPQRMFPALCNTRPIECQHIAARVQKFPRTQVFDNMDADHEVRDMKSVQAQNRLEWFVNSKVLGDHHLQLKQHFYSEWNNDGRSRPGDRKIEYNGEVPDRETTYYSNDPRLEPARYGFYFQNRLIYRNTMTLSDAWKPTRYLTVTPAVSHIWAQGNNGNGDTVVDQQTFAPAVSAAWDATHDGRTVIRGSYNQYVDIDVNGLASHTNGSGARQTCRWNADSNQFDKSCVYSGGASRNTFGLPCGPTGIDEQGRPCRESLGIPRTYEYTLGAEREIVQGVALSLDFVYREFDNLYETSETNRIWTQSGGGLEPTGNYRNGRNETIANLGTPDGVGRKYRGATIGMNKRDGRFKIKAAYTLSDLTGNNSDRNYGNNGGSFEAWGDIPGRDVYLWGPLPDDHRHEIKISSTYQLAEWLSMGMRYRYFSGLPYNRLYFNEVTGGFEDFRAPVGVDPGSNINDPGDDRALRMPDLQDFNVQLRASLLPLIGQHLDFYVDVLNVLALRTTNRVGQQDGRDFGLPTRRMDPLHVRLGLNYRY